VHLRDRRGSQRLPVEALENRIDGLVVGRLEDSERLLRGKRGYRILQLRQFVRDIGRQQVAAGRDCLAELDEDRSEFLECETDALALRRAAVTAPRRQVEEKTQRPKQVCGRSRCVAEMISSRPYLTRIRWMRINRKKVRRRIIAGFRGS
jgi:hypothetical protein